MMFGIRMIPYGMRYVAEAMVSCRTIQVLERGSHVKNTLIAENSLIARRRNREGSAV